MPSCSKRVMASMVAPRAAKDDGANEDVEEVDEEVLCVMTGPSRLCADLCLDRRVL